VTSRLRRSTARLGPLVCIVEFVSVVVSVRSGIQKLYVFTAGVRGTEGLGIEVGDWVGLQDERCLIVKTLLRCIP
jgi:hypothetical protein